LKVIKAIIIIMIDCCFSWNSNFVILLEGLCISNPFRFDCSMFDFLPGSNRWPQTVPHSAQLNYFYIVLDVCVNDLQSLCHQLLKKGEDGAKLE